jgi:hypothetical protein
MADALPIAQIIHAMPARARLRIASRRGNRAFFASIATGVSAIPGVYKVEVRPLTGSILIQHGAPLENITTAAQKARLFIVGNSHSAPPTTEAVSFDSKLVLGLGLGALSIWQLAEGRILPPAITLAWYAASLAGLLSNDNSGEAGE